MEPIIDLPVTVTKYQHTLIWLGFHPSSFNVMMMKISIYCPIPVLAKGVKYPKSRLIIVCRTVKLVPLYAAVTAK